MNGHKEAQNAQEGLGMKSVRWSLFLRVLSFLVASQQPHNLLWLSWIGVMRTAV